MEKKKKYIKIIGIILLSYLLLFVIGFVISQFTLTEKSTNAPISSNETEKADTFEDDMKTIQRTLNDSDITMTEIRESTYSITANCKPVDYALGQMLYSLKRNKKINENWNNYCTSNYDEWKSDYSPSKQFEIYIGCNINSVKTNDEMKEIMKDCSQFIWESMNLIYSNPNINNNDNKYFGKLHYSFSFNYSYIDDYGNTQEDTHHFYFDITRNSYNKINLETFPNILLIDYTKLFNLGEATYKLGKKGIQIDFENLLIK